MTVSAQAPFVTRTYAGPGVYSYDFLLYDTAHMQVTIMDDDGESTVLTVANYSVTTLKPNAGGTVTITDPASALPATGTLYLRRILPYQQSIDWVNNERFNMELLERSQDQLVMMIQQIAQSALDLSVVVSWPEGVPDLYTMINTIQIAADEATAAAAAAQSDIDNLQVTAMFDTVAAMVAAEQEVGELVGTRGYWEAGDGGDAVYFITTGTADGAINHSVNGGSNIASYIPKNGHFNVKESGIKDSASLQSVFDSMYIRNFKDYPDLNPIPITTGVHIEWEGDGTTWSNHARNSLDGLTFLGNNTQTLLRISSSYSTVRDCTFRNGAVGLTRIFYVTDGYKNHYNQCDVGLQLDGTTSHTEYEIYASGCTEAALHIGDLTGISRSELTTLIGGAIEGNRGSAIKAENITGSFKLFINSVYFELNGDKNAGTPQFDIPTTVDGTALVYFRNSKFGYNVVGDWTTGNNNFGDNVVFDASEPSGFIYADKGSCINGTVLQGVQLNKGDYPFFMYKWDNVSYDGGENQIGGLMFSAALRGRLQENFVEEDLAPLVYPYGDTFGSNLPTLSEDSTYDYGDGSWIKAVFTGVSGGWANNILKIGSFYTGETENVVQIFMIRSETDTEVEFLETGFTVRVNSIVKLKANTTYKMFAIGNNYVNGNNALHVWPTGTDAPTLYIKPLHQVAFATQKEASSFISKNV